MAEERSPRDRLLHILDAISAIETFVRDKSIADFQRDRMLRDAVERNIERLSEASRHLPPDLTAGQPGIPW